MFSKPYQKQRQLQKNLGFSDKTIAVYREYIHGRILSRSYAYQGTPTGPFKGVSWEYFLADLELEARAARIKMSYSSIGSICDTINSLPSASIVRMNAALFVYFTPLEPDNESQVDYLLQPLDEATTKLMRQRRHAVHAVQAIEARQENARKEADAKEAEARGQWYACPRSKISTEPENFFHWIKIQAPDTWHEIIDGWDYNSFDLKDVIEWVLDQPQCDLGTAAQFFFTCGLANEDPEKLSPGYRRGWHLMKRVAENWQRGLYVHNELQPSIEPSDIISYDALVVRREAEGRPLAWNIPGPKARRFGSRMPNSMYFYEHGHLKLAFSIWKKQREQSGCGENYPHFCTVNSSTSAITI